MNVVDMNVVNIKFVMLGKYFKVLLEKLNHVTNVISFCLKMKRNEIKLLNYGEMNE